jgi:hypothetical protein
MVGPQIPPYDSEALRDWRRKIEAHRKRNRKSFNDIANAITGGNTQTVRNWLSKGTAPPPAQLLETFALAVGADPIDMLKTIGLVRDDQLHAIVRALELEREVRDLRVHLDQLRRTAGAGRLVDAALSHGGWKVRTRPVFYGAGDLAVRYSERITFVPLDFRRVTTAAEAREAAEHDFGDVLRAVGAIPRVRDRPDDDDDPEHPSARYYIRALEAMRAPYDNVVLSPYDRVVVISTVRAAWPGPIASLVARGLGFGYIGLRQLATMRYGARGDTGSNRADTINSLLTQPSLTSGYCLSFATEGYDAHDRDALTDSAIEFLASGAGPKTFVVVLDETNSLLLDERGRPARDASFMTEIREALGDAFSHENTAGMRVTISLHSRDRRRSEDAINDLSLERSMYLAGVIVTALQQHGMPRTSVADDAGRVLQNFTAKHQLSIERVLSGTISKPATDRGVEQVHFNNQR